MRNTLKCLWKDEQGQDLTEYALLLTLVALVAVVVISGLGVQISTVFANASTSMT